MGDETPEREVKDFQFRCAAKIRLSPSVDKIPGDRSSLLAVSNSYGLIFTGYNQGFKVLQSCEIASQAMTSTSKNMIDNFPNWTTVEMEAPPTHLSISSDSLTLAVCSHKHGFVFADIFDVRAFAVQKSTPAPFLQVKLSSSPSSELLDLCWNPGLDFPSLFAVCLSDGSVSVYQVKEGLKIVASGPTGIQAKCLCWSPKGKQLVVGKVDGSLAQYDQGLSKKKDIVCPDTFQGKDMTVVDLLWESTHVFLVAYELKDNVDRDQPVIVLISSSKEGTTKYTNFEDPCFGGGEERHHKVYMNFVQEWGMVVLSSANALEAGVLGRQEQNKAMWELWNLDDAARAELPLGVEHTETYPMGMAIDRTSQYNIPLGDNKTHPASPILLLLSTDGVLICFHMMNTRAGCLPLTVAPHTLSGVGERKLIGAPSKAPDAQQAQNLSVSTSAMIRPPSQAPDMSGKGAPVTSTATAPVVNLFGGLSGKPSAGFNFGNQSLNLGQPLDQSTPHPSAALKVVKPSISQATPLPQPVFTDMSKVTNPSAPKSGLNTGQSSGLQAGLKSGFQFGQSSSLQAGQNSGLTIGQGAGASSGFQFGQSSGSQTASRQDGRGGEVKSGQGFSFGTPATESLTASGRPVCSPSSEQTTQVQQRAPDQAGPDVRTQQHSSVVSDPRRQEARTPDPARVSQTTRVTAPAVPDPRRQDARISQAARATSGAPPPPYQAPAGQRPAPTVEVAHHKPQMSTSSHRGERSELGAGSLMAKPGDPFAQAIDEEMTKFQRELDQSLSVAVVDTVGSKAEQLELRRNTEEIRHFLRDITETTQSVNSDIHELKSRCLEGFATLEECNLRFERSNYGNNKKQQLNRGLDPISERQLRDIRGRCQYMDTAIRDIDHKLDTKWEAYQNSKNKRRMEAPITDTIYRTLNANQKVITEQNRALDKLTCQLKDMRMYNMQTDWNHSPRGAPSRADVSTANIGSTVASSVHGLPDSADFNLSISAMSPEKNAKLRDFLGNRRVTPVKCKNNTDLTKSIMIQSPDRTRLSQRHYQSPVSRTQGTSQPISFTQSPGAHLAHSPGGSTGHQVLPQKAAEAANFWGSANQLHASPQLKSPGSTWRNQVGTRPPQSPVIGSGQSQWPAQISGQQTLAPRLAGSQSPVIASGQSQGHPQIYGQQALSSLLSGSGQIGGALASAMFGADDTGEQTESLGFRTKSTPFDHNLQARDVFGSTRPAQGQTQEAATPPGSPPKVTAAQLQIVNPGKKKTGSVVPQAYTFTTPASSPSPSFNFGKPGPGKSTGFSFGGGTSLGNISFGAPGSSGSSLASSEAVKMAPTVKANVTTESNVPVAKAAQDKKDFALSDGGLTSSLSGKPSAPVSAGFGFNASAATQLPTEIVKETLKTTTESTKSSITANLPSRQVSSQSDFSSTKESEAKPSAFYTNFSFAAAPPATDTNNGAAQSSFSFTNVNQTLKNEPEQPQKSPDSGGVMSSFSFAQVNEKLTTDDQQVTGQPTSSTSSFVSGFAFSDATTPSGTTAPGLPPSEQGVGSVFGGSSPGGTSGASVFSVLGSSSVFGSGTAPSQRYLGGISNHGNTAVKVTSEANSTTTKTDGNTYLQSKEATITTSNPSSSTTVSQTQVASRKVETSIVSAPSSKPVVGMSAPKNVQLVNATATPPSMFSQLGSTGSLSGQTGTASTNSSTFGQAPKTATLFGNSNTSTTSAKFAQPASVLTTASSALIGRSLGSASTAAVGQPSPTSTLGASSTASTGLVGSQMTTKTDAVSTTSSVLSQLSSLAGTGSLPGQTSSVTTTASIFGQPATAASTNSVFGQQPASATTTSSIFSSSGTSTSSAFGQPSRFGATVTTASAFGQSAGSVSTTAPAGASFNQTGSKLFGGTAPQSTQGGSIFGGTAPQSTQGGSIFGGTAPQSTESGSIFGGTAPQGTQGGSIFGGTAPQSTQGGSIFGGTATQSTQGGSIFGGTAPQSTQGGSIFGGTAPQSTQGGSIFGGTAAPSTQGGSIFGGTAPQSTQGGSIFGGTAAPSTQGGSIFGGTAPQTTQGGSIFGGSSQSTGSTVFGVPQQTVGSSTFGGSSQTSGTPFGTGQQSGTTTFGGAQSGTSAFGQSGASSAAAPDAAPSLGGFGGLGGKPSAENANKNVFGTATTFGANTQQTSSLFGSGQSTGTFGSTATTSSTGAFSGTSSNIGGTGFGGFQQSAASPKPAQSAGGFGASPSFGGSAAFGSPAGFGGGAMFASPFGGSPAVSTAPGAGIFGSGAATSPPPSAAFSGFANAGSPTFGALAQGGGNTSFGGDTGFGAQNQGFGQQPQSPSGAAFTSYRS